LTLCTGGGLYCLSTASVLRWYSHTLNRIQTLIVLVETFFLASFFLFAVLLLFVVCLQTNRIFNLNNLTFQTRNTVLLARQ